MRVHCKALGMMGGPQLCYLITVFLSNSIIINPHHLILTVISLSFYSIMVEIYRLRGRTNWILKPAPFSPPA